MSSPNPALTDDAATPPSATVPELVLPDARDLVLRVMTRPSDANLNGDIFGGWIMGEVDLAGAVLASRIARGRIVTVAVGQLLFKRPVAVGDLLSFYATVNRIGTTSVTVDIRVYAERDPSALQVFKVTEATLTYVAIDADSKPRTIARDGA